MTRSKRKALKDITNAVEPVAERKKNTTKQKTEIETKTIEDPAVIYARSLTRENLLWTELLQSISDPMIHYQTFRRHVFQLLLLPNSPERQSTLFDKYLSLFIYRFYKCSLPIRLGMAEGLRLLLLNSMDQQEKWISEQIEIYLELTKDGRNARQQKYDQWSEYYKQQGQDSEVNEAKVKFCSELCEVHLI